METDIFFARPDRPQYTDLFRALHHRNIRNHPDHDSRNHQRNSRERYQNIGDRIEDRLHQPHQHAHRIRVFDFRRAVVPVIVPVRIIIRLPGCIHRFVPLIKISENRIFRIKIPRINLDGIGSHIPSQRAHKLRRARNALFGKNALCLHRHSRRIAHQQIKQRNVSGKSIDVRRRIRIQILHDVRIRIPLHIFLQ